MASKRMYEVGTKVYYLTDEQVEFGNALLKQFSHKLHPSLKLEPVEIFGFTDEEEKED